MTDYAARRRTMVDTQIRPSDVTKFPIIAAMLNVERELFVPANLVEAAYSGDDLDLGAGRSMLAPRTLAKMLDALDITGDELVLDVGCGLGYTTAVLAQLAQAVVAVETDAAAVEDIQALLSEAGADNAIVQAGDLAAGAAEHGPYDVVLIEGGVEQLPPALVAQIKDGGRIACIFMQGNLGEVRIGYKTGGGVSWRFEFNATAPVLPGFARDQVFAL